MANGELCITCEFQETDHKLELPDTCGNFISKIEHHANCPVLDCAGECENTIASKKTEGERQRYWRENQLMVIGDQVMLVDVGS